MLLCVLIILGVISIVTILSYLFPVIQVCGVSMFPTFNDGDIILCCRIFPIRVSDIYVYQPPVGRKYVIKRLKRTIKGKSALFFEGDNSNDSFDSRDYGYVSKSSILARYILVIHRKEKSND